MDEPGKRSPAQHVVMWGASGSGKTTFLAALNIALLRQSGYWRLAGTDSDSTEKLVEHTHELAIDRTFPHGTVGVSHTRCRLSGQTYRPRLFRKPQEESVEIDIDLVDSAGELLEGRSGEDLVDKLSASRAMILFIDPVIETEIGNTFEHIYRVLAPLSQLMAQSGRTTKGRMPHYVAVCLTKFDDIRVYKSAEELGLLSYDASKPGYPEVSGEDARELIMALSALSRSGYAHLAVDFIERCFHPERVRYFITSAVGFYISQESARFDPNDFQNVMPGDHNDRIRGPIYPINVAESVLWLCDKLAQP
jgi:energy-coupling factor transporter ATP-binding protein EcfA2